MPIAIDRNTYECDDDNLSPKKRLELYGQEDYHRLYGREAKEHISFFGFKMEEYKVDDILNETQIKHNRILKGDRMFIGTKIPM